VLTAAPAGLPLVALRAGGGASVDPSALPPAVRARPLIALSLAAGAVAFSTAGGTPPSVPAVRAAAGAAAAVEAAKYARYGDLAEAAQGVRAQRGERGRVALRCGVMQTQCAASCSAECSGVSVRQKSVSPMSPASGLPQ
jgi:hypothetical protein